MALHIWDYDAEKLKKSRWGRLLILERQINYGMYLSDKDKIKLSDVRKHWRDLKIDPDRRRFFRLLIWGK